LAAGAGDTLARQTFGDPVEEVVMSIATAEAGPALVSLRASIACDDLYALPARLGAPTFAFPQIGWSDSFGEGERWLALGEADAIHVSPGAGFDAALDALARARERLKVLFGAPANRSFARYIGGIAFDPRDARAGGWPSGGAARFVLPKILMRQSNGQAEVTVIGTAEPEARRIIAALAAAARESAPGPSVIRIAERVSPERRAQWAAAVREVLAAIEAGSVRKVVLSRDLLLDCEDAIDPWNLLRLVHDRNPHGYRFCFRFDGDSAFLGASPERLVAQRGSSLACDCLAGTIARGRTGEADARNAERLLASDKDGREHRIVLEEILAAIAPHVSSRESPASPRIMPLPEVQHLWSPVHAVLRDGVGIERLVASLHPTAAVGGSPRLPAMDLIRALEGRSRGWYAGLVGWVGIDDADFAVAIRSAIVRGSRVTAVGGAGIVRGSDPEAEWDETARKAASLINLFAEPR
jgi:menaquinone-specific isochorismate synthase